MGFFDSVTNERKLQAIDTRLAGFKEQLFATLISAGVDPDSFDLANFNPLTDIAEQFAPWRTEITRLIDAINQINEIRGRIAE